MNRRSMRAVVTGGCGFIGSHIVERLVREGFVVRVLDDLSSGKEENISHLSSRVELTVGDIRDTAILGRVLDGADVVFHEAAFVSVPESERNPSECFDINVGGIILLLKESERRGVKRLIFASSCAVYGNCPDLPLTEDASTAPGSPYALSKSVAEQIMREFCSRRQVGITSLRYFNVYGPRQNPESRYAAVVSKFIEDGTRRKKLVVEGTGDQTRDFVFVGDVAEANLLAARSGNAGFSVMNVCSGTEISVAGLAGMISSELGGVSVEHAPARENDIMRSWGSNARAAGAIGFHPATGITEGLKITIRDHVERSSK